VYGRLVRGQVLALREREFVVAAQALGAPSHTITPRHILPNVLTLVIIVGTFTVASNVITEASLSFLGLGVQPSIP
jgi:peptide/nickel transport system permease protein